MKEKMSTFKALDILNCSLYWINMNVNNIKEHKKALDHLIEKFEIEKDIEGINGEYIIKDYLLIMEAFINATEHVTKNVDNYLGGRGISNNRNTAKVMTSDALLEN